ncbi:MAG: tRNA pseudouridine(38-40) synthase TruA [SAR202 cluster bacterium Io17-Chloro-G9]|nr:MAG: tRNA pseudouridine(38-40) synthase TruA [SAR202 cluster bacterium Io17-Chloro-G9]
MGFQLQPNHPTIQGEIEHSLYKFTSEKIRIRGASRTDSGAHAQGQVVDFLSHSANQVALYPAGLNFYLPRDIRVQAAYQMVPSFHSRKDASSRIYRYHILNRRWPSPLGRHTNFWVRGLLDAEGMAAAAKNLVGEHDFRRLSPGFAADHSAVRTVYRWEVWRDDDKVIIECEANGFLRHLIRRANALLIEVGKGKWPKEIVTDVLKGECTGKIEWTSAPARGLCLMKVTYPNFWSQVCSEDETD